MFILYTVAPILYRMASSAFYNISLLTSDFYGLLFGLFLFVRVSLCFTLYHTDRFATLALLRVLALLPRLRGRPPRARHLLLDRDPRVAGEARPALARVRPAPARDKRRRRPGVISSSYALPSLHEMSEVSRVTTENGEGS
jgi:hypothetical protein